MSTKPVRYLQARGGIYYFNRRVPEDLRGCYRGDRIVLSLRTASLKIARARAAELAAKLDREWIEWRWLSAPPENSLNKFRRQPGPTPEAIGSRLAEAPTIEDARRSYAELTGQGRPPTFFRGTERAVEYLVEVCGSKAINAYTRSDANALRDKLLARGLKVSSIKRVVGSLQAIIGFASREHGLPESRAFSKLHLPDNAQVADERPPLPIQSIREIQQLCYRIDDEARWLIALISDSGLRLSEAAGLAREDLHLDDEYPYLRVRQHPWRRLKTPGSDRVVPLVGASLWSARRALLSTECEFLFPRYCSQAECRSNSASGALNKWLRPRVPKGCVIHSFRHSFRDRLRAVECQPDVIDRLGGWSVEGVGERYGHGYPLTVLHRWMEKLESRARSG